MHRKPILEIIDQYYQNAPIEEHCVLNELKNNILQNKNCFERNHEENAKHIATSTLLLTPDKKEALFLWHTKIQLWTQPGGHMDGDSDILAVAKKELLEETGISNANYIFDYPIDIYRFDYPKHIFGYKKSIYNFFFIATISNDQFPKIMEPNKCQDMRWATPQEAIKMTRKPKHEGVDRLIEKWKKIIN